ncbi:RxLR effector protein [Phytophthora megakarya]|uniref:RxLR effector protein n=1 Tax=Phytophthora megakarya TaxID=4795 RepID=A0A225VLU7_9STRA|nr:RxLR effector protein [Phytophthora megakarya]
MWFQVWLLVVVLGPLKSVLAIEADAHQSFTWEPHHSVTPELTPTRFLRAIDAAPTDVGLKHPHSSQHTNEERAITVPHRFKNAGEKIIVWSHNKLYRTIEWMVGPHAANKAFFKLIEHVYYPILYRFNKTPDDFLKRARVQYDPIKRLHDEQSAALYAAWIAKYHPY